MTEQPGLLIVFSGPSGVGKDTVLAEFLASRDDCMLSISATTRRRRPGEVDGKDYYFVSRETFTQWVNSGEMLEYAEYSGNCYGTPAQKVRENRNLGRHVILEIEVQGALQVKEACPDAVLIFLMPPDLDTLRHRLQNRGTETPEMVAARLAAAEFEMSKACEYDYIIVNRSVSDCCKKLDAIVTAAGCGVKQTLHGLQKECNDA